MNDSAHALGRWSRRRWLPAAAACAIASGAGRAVAQAVAPSPASQAVSTAPPLNLPVRLRMTFSRPVDSPRTQWLIAVYREALGPLGIGFEYVDVPPARALIAAEAGDVDGELGRTYAYGDLNPTMVRIAESNNRVEFAAFAIQPDPFGRFPGWPAVRARQLTCEHRRGVQELAVLLAREVDPRRVSAVATIEQGVRRLQLRRTDLYFEVREAVEDHFEFGLGSPETMAGPRPVMLDVIESTTGHAYLHRRHQALAPLISRALTEMKRQGRVQRLREEAVLKFRAEAASKPR